MPTQAPREPIAPATIPGQPTDPKIPPEESETEQQARESEKAFDQAITRLPPG